MQLLIPLIFNQCNTKNICLTQKYLDTSLLNYFCLCKYIFSVADIMSVNLSPSSS